MIFGKFTMKEFCTTEVKSSFPLRACGRTSNPAGTNHRVHTALTALILEERDMAWVPM